MKISNETWDLLIKEHTVNKLSVKAICEKYNMKYTTVYYGLRNHGITPNRELTDRRKYKVEDNFFSVIDTNFKAYVLGLLICDGSAQTRVSQSSRVYIKLKEEDKYLLEAIKNKIAPEYSLTLGSSVKNNKVFYYNRLEIASDKLVSDLSKLGMVQDKFMRVLPVIPVEFKGSLIRGIFDADGSISKTKRKGVANSHQVYIAGSNLNFIKALHKYLGLGSLYLNKRAHLGNRDVLYLRFNKVEEKIRLFNLIYSDTSIYLKRKLDIYTNYANTVLSSEGNTLSQRNAYELELLLGEDKIRKSVRHPNLIEG